MDNETWILEAVDRVIQKKARCGVGTLSAWELLVYCLWVADYGMRNAGDLDTAGDLFASFQTDGAKTAKSLSLPYNERAFSLPRKEFESRYFELFDSICDELRRANPLPEDASDAAILAAVDQWAARLGAEQYEIAFYETEHDVAMRWTPELMRQVITQYGEAEPGQKVTVEGKPTDISQRKDVRRFPKNKHGFVGHVWYDLNINGFASDLTATFNLRATSIGLELILEDIHVM